MKITRKQLRQLIREEITHNMSQDYNRLGLQEYHDYSVIGPDRSSDHLAFKILGTYRIENGKGVFRANDLGKRNGYEDTEAHEIFDTLEYNAETMKIVQDASSEQERKELYKKRSDYRKRRKTDKLSLYDEHIKTKLKHRS